MPGRDASVRVLGRGSWPEARRIAEVLRRETVGGVLLLIGAVVALVWANSPWSGAYEALREIRVGPAALGLKLPLSRWASDGLLAVFFFVAGLELKREFVAGDLRDPRRAAVPVAAAFGGVAVPALLFTAIALVGDRSVAGGWAIPTATDIAFALAVLAVVGHSLPAALRTFLLTLAVVDDLIAIVIIAVFYTRDLAPLPLLVALAPLAVFTVLVQRRVRSWWLLIPLAVLTWGCVHASGVHATVAGVVLGFAVPVVRSERAGGPDAGPGLAEHFERRFRPLSAAVVVPVFAFFAAGVAVGGLSGLADAVTEPVTLGVVTGLVLGKAAGITGATWLVARFTRARLDDELTWTDVAGLGALGGIGFTVSLLIGELAFGAGNPADDHVKIGIFLGSLSSALVAVAILRVRARAHRRICAQDTLDTDLDGVPDSYRDPR